MTVNIPTLLTNIEKNIADQNERSYFWTHEVRYKFILKKIVETQNFVSLENKTVLDIGCYPYHLGKALEDLGFEVHGISSEHEPIKNNPRIKTVNIETERFPFEDEKFNLVLWSEVLEHLIRTPKIPLREIKRVLKKDGVCIITTPNVLRSINRFSMIFGRSIYPGNKEFYSEEAGDASLNYRHNKEYTIKEMEEIVNEVGMKVKNKEYFTSYTPFRKRKVPDKLSIKAVKFVNYLLMLLFPALRDSLYLEIVKD